MMMRCISKWIRTEVIVVVDDGVEGRGQRVVDGSGSWGRV